jgi:hypothetical protein
LKKYLNFYLASYHLVQSWNRSGSPAPVRPDRTRPDKTGRKVHPAGRNRIFAGFFSIFLPDFLPDFCRIFVNVTSKMNRTDFTGFFSIFLPDFL